MLVKELLTDSALTHATVFPLQNVSIPGLTNYHTIRKIVFDSIKDPSPPLYSGPMETLKWIAYQKWDGIRKNTTNFECRLNSDIFFISYLYQQNNNSAGNVIQHVNLLLRKR